MKKIFVLIFVLVAALGLFVANVGAREPGEIGWCKISENGECYGSDGACICNATIE